MQCSNCQSSRRRATVMTISQPPTPLGSPTLAGKIAIVTGASRGIGRAIALRLARERTKLVLAARDEAALAKVVAEVAAVSEATLFPADLRSPDAPAALVSAGIDAYGAIHNNNNNPRPTLRRHPPNPTNPNPTDGFALKFFGSVR